MNCAACGETVKGGIGMGGVLLCQGCAEDIRVEMDALRAANKRVNVPAIARRMYRERHPADSDYLLREPPPGLIDALRRRALDEYSQGQSPSRNVRDLVIRVLQEYVQDGE